MKFFAYTRLYFSDDTTRDIKVPMKTLLNYRFPEGNGFGFRVPLGLPRNSSIDEAWKGNVTLGKGLVLAKGYVDTGDQVLVDKVSYHFRQPKRVAPSKGVGAG